MMIEALEISLDPRDVPRASPGFKRVNPSLPRGKDLWTRCPSGYSEADSPLVHLLGLSWTGGWIFQNLPCFDGARIQHGVLDYWRIKGWTFWWINVLVGKFESSEEKDPSLSLRLYGHWWVKGWVLQRATLGNSALQSSEAPPFCWPRWAGPHVNWLSRVSSAQHRQPIGEPEKGRGGEREIDGKNWKERGGWNFGME